MRPWQWAVLGVVTGACFAVAVALLVVEDDDISFPAEVRAEFIADCIDSGLTTGECQCAADGLEDAMTVEEFTAAQAWAHAGGDPDPRILGAIAACLPEAN